MLADQVVHVEVVTGLVVGVVVLGFDVVHPLDRDLETTLVQVGEGEDRLEAPKVGADTLGGIT